MLWVPDGAGGWRFHVDNVGTTQPSGNQGTSVTPGNNTMGSWAECISDAAVTEDIGLVEICFNSNDVSTAARDTAVDIGVDAAGGTSYKVILPNLLASCAPQLDRAQGYWYVFPIRITAGSAVAARASVNNATVGTMRVWIRLWGAPRNPHLVRVGTYCRAFGFTAASSSGHAITPGNAAEGTYTALAGDGSAAIASGDELWWWQFGLGCNNGAMNIRTYHADLALSDDATNFDEVITNQFWAMSSAEWLACIPWTARPSRIGRAGDTVYARLQGSGTSPTGVSGMAYGIGG